MKLLNLILIALLLFSCTKEEEKGQTKPVFVSEVVIPLFANIEESTPIHVKAYAPNGCWSNVKIYLRKTQENHYQITATGFFNGNLTCSDILIEKDTTFHLTFKSAGKYYFQSNENPLILKHDTITITN